MTALRIAQLALAGEIAKKGVTATLPDGVTAVTGIFAPDMGDPSLLELEGADNVAHPNRFSFKTLDPDGVLFEGQDLTIQAAPYRVMDVHPQLCGDGVVGYDVVILRLSDA